MERGIGEHPSPNFGARRGGARPDMAVLHYTGMESAAAARDRLCDPAAEVSAHYLVAETGAVLRLVPEAARAWHAGAAAWGDVTDVNSRSIGIELVNPGTGPAAHPFPEPQMAALEALLSGVMARWAIPPERVVGHACIAPGRKIDPGPRFDWRRLALAGLSVWEPPGQGDAGADAARRRDMPAAAGAPPAPLPVPPAGSPQPGAWQAAPPAAAFQAAARGFGYGVAASGEWDTATRAVWQAFALRFRPAEADGPATAAGLGQLRRLAARWPCRRG
ncbi:N-acetylmuramoyl-L-alanine amidase [Paralimibaculum aggregatum]|uniref:N-acetylmuramoyl-L-alanine amidase n=1 Tax=Paralimibaculum aggregatum TaxID=3036245 RepID=A0ABQ6LH51_9RHOB|nr:N-acetylmuramoyl-L-alanine amidase [Limibaculum sp. NKW23]GMG82332.1 N-acetylmuramoyl-L-alanine amidase [Limibaculum sp. NKW23]